MHNEQMIPYYLVDVYSPKPAALLHGPKLELKPDPKAQAAYEANLSQLAAQQPLMSTDFAETYAVVTKEVKTTACAPGELSPDYLETMKAGNQRDYQQIARDSMKNNSLLAQRLDQAMARGNKYEALALESQKLLELILEDMREREQFTEGAAALDIILPKVPPCDPALKKRAYDLILSIAQQDEY